MEKDKDMQVGVCGIACGLCGLKIKNICQGCGPGDDPEAVERVEFLKEIGSLCPLLDCAVKKKIAYCSRDCKDYPCQIYDNGHPYGQAWIGMYRNRLKAALGKK